MAIPQVKKKFGGKQEGAGRPEKPIDWVLFEELCRIQCTQSEISACLRVNMDAIRERARKQYDEKDFQVIYRTFSEQGKASLRRIQLKLAHKNPSMAIWLGKHWLGQHENYVIMPASKEQVEQFDRLMRTIKNGQEAHVKEIDGKGHQEKMQTAMQEVAQDVSNTQKQASSHFV